MRDRTLLLLIVLLAATVVLDGCPPRLRSPGDDDDSSAGPDDDDDTAPTDDDDDDTAPTDDDDDDTVPTDDDDDDDDDVTPVDPSQVTFSAALDLDCEGPLCAITIDYAIHYWSDLSGGLLDCTQHVVGTGEAALGFGATPGCGNCTAGFTLDPAAWVDVSDPSVDPSHCDLAALNATNNNYGEAFTAPAGSFDGAWGDFNQGVFVNAGVHTALGVDYSPDGGLSGEELTATYADDFGLLYAGMIFWDSSFAGSSAEALALAGIFVGEGDSDQFQPALIVYADPEENPFADPSEADGWVGEHAASGTFLYNLQ